MICDKTLIESLTDKTLKKSIDQYKERNTEDSYSDSMKFLDELANSKTRYEINNEQVRILEQEVKNGNLEDLSAEWLKDPSLYNGDRKTASNFEYTVKILSKLEDPDALLDFYNAKPNDEKIWMKGKRTAE